VVQTRTAEPYAATSEQVAGVELRSWLDAIAEVTRAATRCPPLGELLDLIAGATARLTGYDFCSILVEDPERQALLIQGSYGLSQAYIDAINARTPILVRAGDTGEGPSSRAFRSQRPTTVLDISADPASRSWETVAAHQGYSSLLSVPLAVGQTQFGLINCYTAEKHRFSAREIILMESMANQAGLAIETTRRLADARAAVESATAEATALREEICAQHQADADHGELLRVVLKGGGLPAIAESLGAMLRSTVVIDDAAGRLVAAACSDGRPGGRRSGIRPDQGGSDASARISTWLGASKLRGICTASTPPGASDATRRGNSSAWPSSHWSAALE